MRAAVCYYRSLTSSRKGHAAPVQPTCLTSSLLLLSLVSCFSPVAAMSSASNSSSSSSASSVPSLLSRAAVIQPRAAHRSTLIFMHGLGDSANGFRSVFEQLSAAIPNTRIVLPNAPQAAVTVNGGMRMQSWYDIYSLDKRSPINTREDRVGILRSRDAVQRLIEEEATRVPASSILIGGFSQGGALAVLTALTSPQKLAGVVALSAYLLLNSEYPGCLGPHARQTPLFCSHGTDDGVVPYDIAALSWQRLRELGLHLHFETEMSVGHTVSDVTVQKVLSFIRQRLYGAADSEL